MTLRYGAAYLGYLYGATGFQRAMSFGQTPHSGAICTAVVGGQRGRSTGEECNALQRAAKRC